MSAAQLTATVSVIVAPGQLPCQQQNPMLQPPYKTQNMEPFHDSPLNYADFLQPVPWTPMPNVEAHLNNGVPFYEGLPNNTEFLQPVPLTPRPNVQAIGTPFYEGLPYNTEFLQPAPFVYQPNFGLQNFGPPTVQF